MADGLKREVKEVGRECRDDIRDHSPRESGEYADSWSDHVAFERADDIRIIVYKWYLIESWGIWLIVAAAVLAGTMIVSSKTGRKG